MLSFMREQELEDTVLPKPSAADNPAEETQQQEYLTVATHDKNALKSTMLLAFLFGLGLLCLWFMIKKSTPQTAASAVIATEGNQIEMAITRLTGVRAEMFNRMDEIVKKFYEFSDVQQVKVNELVKNPFRHEMFLGSLKKLLNINSGMMRQQQVRQQVKNLQLLSIMQSEQGNCCMIDDKILYEKDSVKGFKVRQIGDSFVKLEKENVEVLLKLSQ